MRKDGAYVKKQRIDLITRYIAGHIESGKLPIRRVILFAEMTIGLSESRAKEYVSKICEMYGYRLTADFIEVAETE